MTRNASLFEGIDGGIVITVVVIAAAVGSAIRTHSLNPIWMIGWLPGVLLALYQPGAGRRCAGRIKGRSLG